MHLNNNCLQASLPMAVYEYRALSSSGKTLKGIIDAESMFAARRKLRERDAYPVELKETSAREEQAVQTKRTLGSYFKQVSQSEVTTMTRQLATLLGAGLPLVSSLTALVTQTSNQHLKKTLAQIKEDVNEGNSLAQSLSHYGRIFPPFYVNMVRAGEASGALDIVLERLADFNEKQRALRGKIRAALTYPLFMFFIGGMVLFVLMGLSSQDYRHICRNAPDASGHHPFSHCRKRTDQVFLAGVYHFYDCALRDASLSVYQNEEGAVPVGSNQTFRSIHRVADAQAGCRPFQQDSGHPPGSGVPLLTALSIVKNVVDNRLIADAIGDAAKDVEEGGSLSATLSRSNLFPLW